MAYINVAEWTSIHVGDWLKGLDDSILPYVQFFVNNNIEGCRLLLLNANDLKNLNITKTGHQEIVLEAVEQLKQLHYNFASETLQSMALRLSCRSRSLHNQLKVQSIANAKRAAQDAAKTSAGTTNEDKTHHHHHKEHKHKKDKKDKKGESNGGAYQQTTGNSQNESTISGGSNLTDHAGNGTGSTGISNETPKDSSPVSTGTLHSVTEILSSVKEFMSWLDRYPFDGNEKYAETRKTVLRCAIELASTAQRDQFVQYPNDVIRERCLEVAEQCDRLIQRLSDSLAMQCATLEVVTVTKSVKEELGMNIVSSYSGIHQVGWLKYDSPAAKNGNIEEGDEIVQVNYQTVVGWQLKKLVASMRQFPMKIILTVKKRPRHFSGANFTLISPFSLPIPDMAIVANGDDRSQHQAVLKNSEKFYGIPAPVVPVPDGALLSFPSSSSTTTNHHSTSVSGEASNDLYSLYSTGPQNPIPVINSAMSTYASYKASGGPGHPALINNQGKMTQPHIAPTSMMPQTLSQYAVAKASIASKTSPAVQAAAEKALASLNSGSSATQGAKVVATGQDSSPSKGRSFTSSASIKRQSHVHRSKTGTKSERKSRVATTRCSSASDSSPFSMSDSTSTMYSSSSEDDHDDDEVDGQVNKDFSKRTASLDKCNSPKVGLNEADPSDVLAQSPGAQLRGSCVNKRPQHQQQQQPGSGAQGSGDNGSEGAPKLTGNQCEGCTTDSEGYSGNDDNDSAFYSGRTTSTNDIHGCASSGHSSGGSASGRCSAAMNASQGAGCPPVHLPPKVRSLATRQTLATPESAHSGNSASKQHSSSPSPSIEAFAVISERSGRQGRPAPVQPRTSAEFEALYLQKTASSSQESMPTTVTMATAGNGKVARASTLPPNAQPCGMLEHESESHDKGGVHPHQGSSSKAKLEKCNSAGGQRTGRQSGATRKSTTTMNEMQQKVVNSLTNLVQNIRVANTVAVNSVTATAITSNPGMSHLTATVHKQKDAKLEALGAEIGHSLTRLTNGDTSMGNYEDTMFIYRGGGESVRSSPPRCEILPQLGPMIIDSTALETSKWSQIHAVLQENTLFTCPVNPAVVPPDCNVHFKLPVHLPGYYILVNKADLLSPSQQQQISSNLSPTSCLLYVFKLVTYHYLYLFATDSPIKIAQWINKFGYRFCCNPADDQLCFTFYLSTPHIKKSDQISTSLPVEDVNDTEIAKTNTPEPSIRGSSSCSMGCALSFTNESELDTDDYNDLIMTDSYKRPSTVKFNNQTATIGNSESPSSTNDLTLDTHASSEAARRFVKSPHPRGSARFACRPLANNQEFIDSIVDPKICLENAMLSTSEMQNSVPVKEQATKTSVEQDSPQVPPKLPPRSSPAPLAVSSGSPKQFTPQPMEAPRPKPRTSKMNLQNVNTPEGGECGNPSLTQQSPKLASKDQLPTASSPGARPKVPPQLQATNRMHLAPIPVPEKSAAISQTIQHFANLQRQNNLRRSSQQMNSGTQQPSLPTVAPPPPPPTKSGTFASSGAASKASNVTEVASQPVVSANSDYDYIGGMKPTLIGASANTSLATCATAPPALPVSKPQRSSPGVGNPLYCSVPPPLHYKQQQQQENWDALATDTTSALDREYARLFGDRSPLEAKKSSGTGTTPASSHPGEESSLSESSCSSTENLPPPRCSPPPLPGAGNTISSTLQNGQFECLSNERKDRLGEQQQGSNSAASTPDDNNNIEDASGAPLSLQALPANSSFASGKITSPKMVRRSNKAGKHSGVQSPTSLQDGITPHPPPLESAKSESSGTQQSSPPTLLPRRAKYQQKTPPPLPTTCHPSLYRASSSSNHSNHSSSGHLSKSPEPVQSALWTQLVHPAILSAKSLNRSFSDAYTRSGNGRGKPRKSLESGLMCSPEQLSMAAAGALQCRTGALRRSCGEQAESGLPSMPSTPTSRSVFIDQLLGSSLQFSSSSSTSDLTSNRSLPTMGVSMLGKKRLSNVSTDCHSIEKALLAHSESLMQQQQQQRTADTVQLMRKPSVGSFDSAQQSVFNNSNSSLPHSVNNSNNSSPLARSVSMNASPCSPSHGRQAGRECTDRNTLSQWEKQIEQTVIETTKRLLKN